MQFSLVQCDAAGQPLEQLGSVPRQVEENSLASAELYRRIGFVEPWVSYMAVDDGVVVGGGAFVGAPCGGRVEIAYFTLQGFEGRGYATATARCLCSIARNAYPGIVISAFTLPELNASTTILGKLGFRLFGTAEDADAGQVWEWRA